MHIRTKALTPYASLLALLLLVPTGAWAQWELDGSASALNFISIKNNSVAETHSFGSLLGYIGSDGNVQLSITLDSVETLIEVRNERMRELLFETASFPTASVTGAVDPTLIEAAVNGGTVTTEVELTLSLHGVERTLIAPVLVIGQGEGQLQVFTPRPVIINAADFKLAAGIEALQKVAGLQSISTAVPVTVHLVFSRPE
jgi:polyisoprenoid-binding protein YceI